MKDEDLSARERVFLVTLIIAQTLSFVLMIGGMYVALLWRPGAYLMLVGLTGQFLTHLGEGLLRYRMVMTRPWPKVTPLDDDDEW